MIQTPPRDLLKTLTPSCIAALERAASRGVAARHHEVGIEHFLLGLLDDRESDFSAFVTSRGIAPEAVQQLLEQRCAALRGGNAGKPTFSMNLMQLFEDALLDAAVPAERAKVRSGDIFGELVRTSSRYQAGPLVEGLRQLCGRGGPLEAPPLGEQSKEGRESRGTPLEPPVPRLPRRTVFHRVVEGEDLPATARRYALDLEDVARENSLGIGDPLRTDSTLRLRVLADQGTTDAPGTNRNADALRVEAHFLRISEHRFRLFHWLEETAPDASIFRLNADHATLSVIRPGSEPPVLTLRVRLLGMFYKHEQAWSWGWAVRGVPDKLKLAGFEGLVARASALGRDDLSRAEPFAISEGAARSLVVTMAAALGFWTDYAMVVGDPATGGELMFLGIEACPEVDQAPFDVPAQLRFLTESLMSGAALDWRAALEAYLGKPLRTDGAALVFPFHSGALRVELGERGRIVQLDTELRPTPTTVH